MNNNNHELECDAEVVETNAVYVGIQNEIPSESIDLPKGMTVDPEEAITFCDEEEEDDDCVEYEDEDEDEDDEEERLPLIDMPKNYFDDEDDEPHYAYEAPEEPDEFSEEETEEEDDGVNQGY